MATSNQQVKPWHAEPAAEVLAALETAARGLSDSEAARRLEVYGANLLPEKGPTPLWRIVLRQFVSPLIWRLSGSRFSRAKRLPSMPTLLEHFTLRLIVV